MTARRISSKKTNLTYEVYKSVTLSQLARIRFGAGFLGENIFMIIALVGRIGSGKDTVAKMIQYYFSVKKYNPFSLEECLKGISKVNDILGNKFLHKYIENQSDWEIKKFATKLKQTVCDFTGCTMEQLEDSDFKENVCYNVTTGEIKHAAQLMFKPITVVMDIYPENSWITFRVLLQDVGMKLRSSIPQIHINGLFSEYKPIDYLGKDPKRNLFYPKWIISDLRLLNEAEAVKSRNGLIVKIVRKQAYESEHVSETQTDSIIPDYVINNYGTIEDLYKQVFNFLTIFE